MSSPAKTFRTPTVTVAPSLPNTTPTDIHDDFQAFQCDQLYVILN